MKPDKQGADNAKTVFWTSETAAQVHIVTDERKSLDVSAEHIVSTRVG